MNKRLGFIAIAGALALAMGCDGDGDADGGMCPEGMICLDGGLDGGGGDDAGPGDAGPPPPCNSVGRSGGLCREGTQCVTGLECMGELLVMGMPLTLGNVFNIQAGELDTMAVYPEYTPTGPSTVRVNVTPGGLCTEGCVVGGTPDTCGECSFCEDGIGGTSAFGAVGISIRSFDINDVIGAGEDGVCRARCDFEVGGNGGCPMGYTCDRFSNTCIEGCVSDAQCNLSWGDSQAEGLVAIELEGAPYTCNMTSGQCEWTAPPTAAFGSDCESNVDCAAGTGLCYFGHCTEMACAHADGTLMDTAGSCPADGAQCLLWAGDTTMGSEHVSTICIGLCNTPDDCPSGQSCRPAMNPIMDGMGTMWAGTCSGACDDNTQCTMDYRCDSTVQRFTDETLGVCNEFCDPMAMGLTGAITCDAMLGEVCEQVEGENYGFCKSQNRLCFTNETCNAGQRCRFEGNDGLGRCEDSCMTNADCDMMAGEECVVVDSDPDDMVTEDRGVCRAPDGTCSPSPLSQTTGDALILLRGATGDAQCISTQECDAPLDPMTGMPMADALGTCVDRM